MGRMSVDEERDVGRGEELHPVAQVLRPDTLRLRR